MSREQQKRNRPDNRNDRPAKSSKTTSVRIVAPKPDRDLWLIKSKTEDPERWDGMA